MPCAAQQSRGTPDGKTPALRHENYERPDREIHRCESRESRDHENHRLGEAVAMVKKDMASGNKPSVVKNHETTAPVAAPETPAPGKVMMKMADGKTTEPNKGQRRNRHSPGTPPTARRTLPMGVGGKIDDLRIRRLDDDRLALGRHRLLLRGFQGAGVFRALAHNLDGGHNLLRVIVIGVSQRGCPGKIFIHIGQHRGNFVSALTLASQDCLSTSVANCCPSGWNFVAASGLPEYFSG